MKNILLFFLLSSFSALNACNAEEAADTYIYQGRVEKLASGRVILISAASSVRFSFTGSKCSISLQSKDSYDHHAYVSLELDGKYLGRMRIESILKDYPVAVPAGKSHTLTVYKATEATTGSILFNGATANLIKTSVASKKKIEFIGDSITSGMGNDATEIPCDTGMWFDQHNAYLAYGPVSARALNADYMLSSVSGIGMYRNWNHEDPQEPIMPLVYGNLYLNMDASKLYSADFSPHITCIALGTNDFSDGDGVKKRLPFNEEKFVSNYIKFVQKIYSHSPDTQVVLINSPMVSGAKNDLFIKCLKQVQDAFKNSKKPIQLFTYSAITPHGCGYHPDAADHKLMASQLTPFLKKLLNEE